ncbi:MAG: HAD hydrolase-like protein [Azoarcus sp.]|jgi:phosphoglycolate phosphatase|nr:HAD hydrolase-like protein [Azoarcus sp.]
MSAPRHIIFDLDGTLIDSAAAILAGYRAAFAACGVTPARALDASIIGPPMAEILRQLTGQSDSSTIEKLAAAFKAGYDSTGYLQTRAYPGIDELLGALRAAGRVLHLATNKRIVPTRLILDHFGWHDHFDAIYALDLFTPRLADKTSMIARLLADRRIAANDAIYVGDRAEDAQAATANQLPFAAATWGYGCLTPDMIDARWHTAATPQALARLLLGDA